MRSPNQILVFIREAEDLFRPYKLVKCQRCVVTLWNNHYYSSKLEPYHGRQVLVSCDIYDDGRIRVRNLDGQLICMTGRDDNKRDYFSKAVIKQARERLRISVSGFEGRKGDPLQ